MDRRTFLAATGAVLLTGPLAADAQQGPMPRIVILTGESSPDLLPALEQFRQELRMRGWIDGQTITVLEPRSAEGRNGCLSELTAEVLKVLSTRRLMREWVMEETTHANHGCS